MSGETLYSELMKAAQTGNAKTMRLLLAAGAPVEMGPGSLGYEDVCLTPLGFALAAGHEECVNTLLNHGVKMNSKSARSDSYLTLALRARDEKSIESLIKAGAFVNEQFANGHTVLTQALLEGQTWLVRLLLDRGADPKAADSQQLKAAIEGCPSEQARSLVVAMIEREELLKMIPCVQDKEKKQKSI